MLPVRVSTRAVTRAVGTLGASKSPVFLSLRNYARETETPGGSVREFAPQGHNPETAKSNLTQTNRLETTMSKFWEKVAVAEKEDGFHVQLDGKTVKTPLGFDLVVPKHKKALAYLLAHEWKHLPSLQIKPYLVPLTSLVSRCIDLERVEALKDAEMVAKIGDPESIKTLLLRYLDTDTLLVFSPATDCDGDLRKAQEELYRPLISSMEAFFAEKSGVEKVELTFMDSDLHGLRGNKQPAETNEEVKQWLDSLHSWSLASLEKSTLTAKSFLSGVAILRINDHDDPFKMKLEEVAHAATLETVLQTKRWGEVEDTHDVDKVDVRRNLAAASLVAFKEKA